MTKHGVTDASRTHRAKRLRVVTKRGTTGAIEPSCTIEMNFLLRSGDRANPCATKKLGPIIDCYARAVRTRRLAIPPMTPFKRLQLDLCAQIHINPSAIIRSQARKLD
jgi:hypothetical protein